MPLLVNIGHWNWIGQTASLLFGVAITQLCLSREEVGLRLPDTPSGWVWTVLAICGAVGIAALPALLTPVSKPSFETLAYQAILPGPVEELDFRGIAWALLMRTFSSGKGDQRASFIVMAVTAIWFTAGHVLQLNVGGLRVRWDRVLNVLPMALWYALVRARSASLLGGMLAHNAANTLVEAAAALRT